MRQQCLQMQWLTFHSLPVQSDRCDFFCKKLYDVSKSLGKEVDFMDLWRGGNIANKASKLVDNLDLGQFVNKIGDYEMYENGEVFYRTMSKEHYEELLKTGRMIGTGETTTSPTRAFSESYEGYLVQFKMKRGTIDELKLIGVTDGNPLVKRLFGKMPMNSEVGGNWSKSKARFKVETLRTTNSKQVNIALGQGEALNIFNNNIIEYQLIKIIKK